MPVLKIKKADGTWQEVWGATGSGDVNIDDTLTQSGLAADAKAVGDALAQKQPIGDYALTKDIPSLDGYATEEYVNQKVESLPSGSVELDNTLTQENKAADAKAVGDRISAIPIAVAEDGYTDISGLRQVTAINTVKNGNTITITTILEGDVVSSTVVILDDDGFPSTITTDNVVCQASFSGFDDQYTDVSEVGA